MENLEMNEKRYGLTREEAITDSRELVISASLALG